MRKQQGFTLVELMVILAVIGIAAGFGVPKLTGMMENNRVTSALNHLSAHMSYTRGEAIKRSTIVTIAPAVVRDWTQGWDVFIDGNGNNAWDAGETIFRKVDDLALPGTISIVGNHVIYNRLGGASNQVTITLTSTHITPPVIKNLTVSVAGGVTIK